MLVTMLKLTHKLDKKMKKLILFLAIVSFTTTFAQNKQFTRNYELVRMGDGNSQVGEIVNMKISIIFYYQNKKNIVIKSGTNVIKTIMFGNPEKDIMNDGTKFIRYMARDNTSGTVYQFSLLDNNSTGVKCIVASDEIMIVCY